MISHVSFAKRDLLLVGTHTKRSLNESPRDREGILLSPNNLFSCSVGAPSSDEWIAVVCGCGGKMTDAKNQVTSHLSRSHIHRGTRLVIDHCSLSPRKASHLDTWCVKPLVTRSGKPLKEGNFPQASRKKLLKTHEFA